MPLVTAPPRSIARTLALGALLGAGFGLATACFETGMGVYKMIGFRMPPTPANVAVSALLQTAIGAVVGTMASPLLRLRRGVLWHAVALFVVWLVLQRAVAPDPSALRMWVVPAAAGLVLYALGVTIARRNRLLPWLLGVTAIAAAVLIHVTIHRGRAAELVAPPKVEGTAPEDAPDVVIVVLDTVRAQSTSAYGYDRPTTPYLERLAGEGALFGDATSPSTWSLPSHASLFTGAFPSAHGAHAEHRILSADTPTLAEVLARHGYETRCFTANPHISDGFGLTRGFAWSDEAWRSASGARSFIFAYRVLDLLGVSAPDKGGADVARNFERWVETREDGGPPTFAFVNFLEAHFPYHQVPDEFLARFSTTPRRELRAVSLAVFGAQFGRRMTSEEVAKATPPSVDMYDAGVAYSDHLLERVVESMRRARTLDRTVLVVLSDHGEMIGEHDDFGHGASVYQPGLRVPLVIRYPPRVRAGARVEQPVSTVGVYATVLDAVNVRPPTRPQVRTLLPALDGRPVAGPVLAERFTFPDADASGPAPLAQRDRRYRVFRSGPLKLVETSRGETFLFDLVRDPTESHDVSREQGGAVARVREELAAWTKVLGLPPIDAPIAGGDVPEIDPAVRERLESLGYTE